MSNILVIPDVHLKPEIFLKAETVVESGVCDRVVMLGDLPDDWGMEENINLYEKTYEIAADFCERHNNTLFCYGNHDISYVWQALENGYSSAARDPSSQCNHKNRIHHAVFCTFEQNIGLFLC